MSRDPPRPSLPSACLQPMESWHSWHCHNCGLGSLTEWALPLLTAREGIPTSLLLLHAGDLRCVFQHLPCHERVRSRMACRNTPVGPHARLQTSRSRVSQFLDSETSQAREASPQEFPAAALSSGAACQRCDRASAQWIEWGPLCKARSRGHHASEQCLGALLNSPLTDNTTERANVLPLG